MMQHQFIYILLGIVVIAFAIITIRDWAGQKKWRGQESPASRQTREITLPLRLQAYERLVVFMERINPENLVNRVIVQPMNTEDARSLMVGSIRSEYDHNVSQQIYVSEVAWEAVSNAKEQLISLINNIAGRIGETGDGRLLGRQLLQLSLKENELPARTALQVLNAEVKKLMPYGDLQKSKA